MKYKPIVADPPWQCDNQSTEAAPEYSERFQYKTMPISEILKIPVWDLPEDNAHLYLWVIDALKMEGYELAKHWGFTPKCELVWIKMSKLGKPFFGMGNYFRHQHECCVFCVKGKMRLLKNDIPTIFFGEATFHSQKPLSFYNIIRDASPAPRIELFARRQVPGFDVWGDDPSINSVDIFRK